MIWLDALKEHRVGYEDYKEYLTQRIHEAQSNFMNAKDFETVLKIKGRVEALQVLLLDATAEEREEQAIHARGN
ncbi:hypothetical protein [Nitrospira sp. BLG_1]|uniref:hypothetical protein n=1 Tax=Nitrospira sp. BLG_1 TaxID=3395883 RepID=UPI0039BD8142